MLFVILRKIFSVSEQKTLNKGTFKECVRSFRVPYDFRVCVPVAFLFDNQERVPVAFLIFRNAFLSRSSFSGTRSGTRSFWNAFANALKWTLPINRYIHLLLNVSRPCSFDSG